MQLLVQELHQSTWAGGVFLISFIILGVRRETTLEVNMIKVQENLYSIREYFQNIADEMYGLFSMRKNIIDSIIPPLIFVIINEVVGFELAMWSSLIIATIFAVFRVVRGQSILSALGGIAAVVVAIVFVKLIGRDESYFIPSILGNFFWLAVFLIK